MKTKIVERLIEGWEFKEVSSKTWMPASVPGCVHTDLYNNNEIVDPFVGTNEIDLQWIGNKSWIYRTKFKIDRNLFKMETIFLNFLGLDTYAKVSLNNVDILDADNMFRAWTVNVKEIITENENELIIKFDSPIEKILPLMKSIDYELPADNDQIKKTSPYTRKAPYHYGWDWGPSFATSGIWQHVELIGYNSFTIKDLFINQMKTDKISSQIECNVFVHSERRCKADLLIKEQKSNINIVKSIDLSPGINQIKKIVEISKPDLWWPNGHGQQNMYEFNVKVESVDYYESIKKRVGLRDFKVEQKIDKKGSSFTFVVNGKPIFSKGANWIPADSFTTRLTKKNYYTLLKSAVDANMNTLRVWGGGIYESDDFYDLCDEMGLIVWQDFMFACTLYPGDKDFLESVRKEAEYQVSRLRNHPSIGLWCGNNEIAWAWHNWGWKDRFPEQLYYNDYNSLFHNVLPSVCNEFDPNRLYWPSSPGDSDMLPTVGQQFGSGDNHYWGVWHSGDKFVAFESNIGRFMSEFGMQSFPDLKTIDYFCEDKDQSINSTVIKQHQKASLGNDNVMKYILMYFKPPKDFYSFVLSSQIMAGEAIKIAAEAHRRNMPYCMGSLYWQLNDCWPGASWSSLDYFGNWKALHYYAKEFFKPLLISFEEEEDGVSIYIVNDGNIINNALIFFEVRNFNNVVEYSHDLPLDIKPNESKKVFFEKKKVLFAKSKKNNILLRAKIVLNDETISSSDYLFDIPKNLKIPKQNFSTITEKFGNRIKIKINSKSFLYKFHILCSNDTGRFDDNYFNMLPGEEKTILFFPSINLKGNINFEPKFIFNSFEGLSN